MNRSRWRHLSFIVVHNLESQFVYFLFIIPPFLCDAYFFLKQLSIGFRLKVHDFSVCGRLVTEREKQLLASKQYTNLIHEQKRIDAEIDKKVRVLILDTNQTTHVRSFQTNT